MNCFSSKLGTIKAPTLMKKSRKTALVAALAAAIGASTYFALKTDRNVSNFLFISDVHLNSFTQETTYGGDTGMILWKAFLTKADSVISKSDPSFIVYAGDLPTHVNFNTPIPDSARVVHNKNIATILTDLRDLATKHDKALMYLPGNNDGIAGDYASFADEEGETPLDLIPENNNPYPLVNMNKTGTQAPYVVSNPEPKIGYFSAKPTDGLRVIAMNTVLHASNYFPADGSDKFTDASQQLSWLSDQLDDAQKQGEKALIALHIPPGINAYNYKLIQNRATNWKKYPAPNDWNNQFLQIVADHQETITGVLYGHTHMDELRRLYNPAGTEITEIGISAPGVTPNHDNNPGFKIVEFDSKSKELIDYTTYYTLPENTTWGNDSYSFNQEFGYSNKNTMFENLSKDNLDSISKKLNKIYMVKHGLAGYKIKPGIDVKTEY